MQKKVKQRGFIQIPILIAIIAGVLIVATGGYFGVRQYQNYQSQKIETEKIAQEERKNQDLEIAKLQEEVGVLKDKKPETITQTIIKEVPVEKKQNITITAEEVEPYLTGVGRIDCKKDYSVFGYQDVSVGSSSLWNFDGLGYSVLTNRHVISDIPVDAGACMLSVADAGDIKADKNRSTGFFFWLDLNKVSSWNTKTDVAIVKITTDFGYGDPPTGLNYSIGSIHLCGKMLLNSPVVVIGFPASTMKISSDGIYAYRTITNGVISAYDESSITEDKLPYANYFISAKIDSGNSGGVAFSKDSSGLCLLGIPTWLSVGNYDTQGIIQNINNVMYVGS